MGESPVTLDERLDLLAKYPAAVKQAIMYSEERLPDVLGVVHSVGSQIQKMKLDASTELDDGEAGKRWVTKIGGKYERSYNTQSLLAKLSEGSTLPATLAFLLQTGVIKIQWNWTPLKKLIRDRSDIRIIKKEIADGDPEWDIGEYWKPSRPTYDPIKEEE